MDISDTRKCNLFNIEMIASYIGAPQQLLNEFYEELINNRDFLNSLNKRVAEIRGKWGFNKGIFAMPSINSIDWFAFERVLIYVLMTDNGKNNLRVRTGIALRGHANKCNNLFT